MTLPIVWFILIAVLWTGYLALEGFDFGVGMLLRILGRDERERQHGRERGAQGGRGPRRAPIFSR